MPYCRWHLHNRSNSVAGRMQTAGSLTLACTQPTKAVTTVWRVIHDFCGSLCTWCNFIYWTIHVNMEWHRSLSDFYLFEFSEWHKQDHIILWLPKLKKKNQVYFSTLIWELSYQRQFFTLINENQNTNIFYTKQIFGY